MLRFLSAITGLKSWRTKLSSKSQPKPTQSAPQQQAAQAAQAAQTSLPLTTVAWCVRPAPEGCWVGTQLFIVDGVVVRTVMVSEPNLKGIVGQQVGDAVMDYMMGSRVD